MTGLDLKGKDIYLKEIVTIDDENNNDYDDDDW